MKNECSPHLPPPPLRHAVVCTQPYLRLELPDEDVEGEQIAEDARHRGHQQSHVTGVSKLKRERNGWTEAFCRAREVKRCTA